MLPWLLCLLLTAAAAGLGWKVLLLRRSMGEMERQLEACLQRDTNNGIFLSARDRRARSLAAALNVQLRELRRARLRYESGDQALKEAVTGVSHDLRTPLTAISGYLELLEQSVRAPDEARYLRCIRERTDAMTRLTEELLRCSLALADPAELHPEAVDLRAAVESAFAAFYGALRERGVTPTVALPPQAVPRHLDPTALSRVLSNLLHNALKYSAGDLDAALTAEGVLTLSNTAPDLDPLQAQRIFERYFTVETGGPATGLGLSIARTLAQRMGGSLEATWSEGRLCFTLAFPPPL